MSCVLPFVGSVAIAFAFSAIAIIHRFITRRHIAGTTLIGAVAVAQLLFGVLTAALAYAIDRAEWGGTEALMSGCATLILTPFTIAAVAGVGLELQSRTRRLRAGICPRCGYELTHLPSKVCPECGLDSSRPERLDDE